MPLAAETAGSSRRRIPNRRDLSGRFYCSQGAARSTLCRGVERAVAAPFRQASETCIACGACAAICPVGTIQVRIHTDTGEAEISPFKSRSKLLICEECGVRMVSVPVAQAMNDRVKIDWEEFRRLARLCPECRRKQAVKALGIGAGEGSVTPLEEIQVKN